MLFVHDQQLEGRLALRQLQGDVAALLQNCQLLEQFKEPSLRENVALFLWEAHKFVEHHVVRFFVVFEL